MFDPSQKTRLWNVVLLILRIFPPPDSSAHSRILLNPLRSIRSLSLESTYLRGETLAIERRLRIKPSGPSNDGGTPVFSPPSGFPVDLLTKCSRRHAGHPHGLECVDVSSMRRHPSSVVESSIWTVSRQSAASQVAFPLVARQQA